MAAARSSSKRWRSRRRRWRRGGELDQEEGQEVRRCAVIAPGPLPGEEEAIVDELGEGGEAEEGEDAHVEEDRVDPVPRAARVVGLVEEDDADEEPDADHGAGADVVNDAGISEGGDPGAEGTNCDHGRAIPTTIPLWARKSTRQLEKSTEIKSVPIFKLKKEMETITLMTILFLTRDDLQHGSD